MPGLSDEKPNDSPARPGRGMRPLRTVRLTPKTRRARTPPLRCVYVDPFDRVCLGLDATARATSQPQPGRSMRGILPQRRSCAFSVKGKVRRCRRELAQGASWREGRAGARGAAPATGEPQLVLAEKTARSRRRIVCRAMAPDAASAEVGSQELLQVEVLAVLVVVVFLVG